MQNDGPNSGSRRIFLLFFLALNFFFLLTSSGRVRTIDEVSVDLQTESLALRGNTAVPQAETLGTFYGKRDRWGQPRAPYGTAQAAIVLPWHYAGRFLRSVLPGIPPRSKDVFLDAFVTASSATFSALAAALTFLIFTRLEIETKTALWAAFIIALGTPLFSYSGWFFSEPLVAAVLLCAALVLFGGGDGAEISLKQGAIAGLLLGFAIWVRPTHAIAVPVFLLALLIGRREKTAWAAIALTAVVGILGGAYLLRNQICFGNPLEFGYPDTVEGGKQLNTFHTPLATGLIGYLLSPGKSIFLFAPPVLLAIAGIPKLSRRNFRLAIVAGIMPLAYVLFFARYTQWEGGYCAGPRYLLPSIPMLCLGLGPQLAERGKYTRWLAVSVLCCGAFVNAITLATSFLEDQANGTYYDRHWNYRMDYAPAVSQTRLLFHYVVSPEPARIGLGFDRWFVFLAKTGVAHGLIAAGLVFELAGLLLFGWWVRRQVQREAG